MTLDFETQHRLAIAQDSFRDRVQAAMFSAAVTLFNAAPNADPTKQGLRLALVNVIVSGRGAYAAAVTAFAWTCVSRSTVSAETDLTDAFLTTTCATVGIFDALAQELMA